MNHPSAKRCSIVSAAILGVVGQAHADSSGQGFAAAMLGEALAVGAISSFSGLAVYSTASGNSTGVIVVVGILVAMSGISALGATVNHHKDLVVQLKVDHDTYLAGGGRTPFLEEVCRGLLLRTKAYSVEDPRTGRESIDEQKLTSAIDQLVEMAEKGP